MTILYAQPYDISADGFYFESADDYAAKAKANRNSHGDPVEEYEIQFIDGEDLNCALAKAWELNQANFPAFYEAAENWEQDDKLCYIVAVGECGYAQDSDPSQLDVTLYQLSSMRELAVQFVEDGLYGEIPKRLFFYLDYDAIARDLSMDYSEITIAGTHYIFHCT